MDFDYNVEKQEITVELNSPRIELDTPTGGRGLKGDKGNPGAKGDTGGPGTPGKDGEAATITVGSTTTGDAGTDASVTNSGTTSAAVLDFTIPKGDKGDTGDTGETGNGISSIEKTSTSGLVDTYTIYFTDGTTTTYTVTNGSGGGGSTTDVQINGTSITSGGTANIITEGVYSASTNKIATMSDLPTVPTKVSDLTNDSGFIDGLTILSYGSSTWNDFLTAYNKNKVVYCRASSNSDPSSGSQTRLAFMAYVNNATSPTSVEFQYYRSVSSHSDSQQGDQVFVYKITSAGTWTVTTRNNFTKIVAGGDLSSSYASGTLTISADIPTVPTNVSDFTNDAGYLTSHQDISAKVEAQDITDTINTIFGNLSVTTWDDITLS